MRQYYFTIQSCNHEYPHERGVLLKDDAAALTTHALWLASYVKTDTPIMDWL